MVETPDTNKKAPRVAFLGFCERAETITAGHVFFWKTNLIGVSNTRVFHIFPSNLRGTSIALGIYEPKAGDSFKFIFQGLQGQPAFEMGIGIAGLVESISQAGSAVVETPINTTPGWALITEKLNTDVVVMSQGNYEVFLKTGNEEQYLATITFAHLAREPFTPEEITALKSNPLATKFVRMRLSCNSCGDTFKAYAGFERSVNSESQGFRWNLDITEREYICSCGKTRVDLGPIRTGLHGLLDRNVRPLTDSTISSVRLYEQTTLEQFCRDLLKLADLDSREEDLQKFLEAHPIFFHIFLPTKLIFKPPILTKYFADFAVLNARNELLLIEIERPRLQLLKKDGGITADLGHAFHQARTWTQELNDHRAAALDAMGLELREVAKVKSVVVAGRVPADEKKRKMLRAVSTGDTELYTYDDLLSSVTELIKHVANI
jgi:hypothetical protein